MTRIDLAREILPRFAGGQWVTAHPDMKPGTSLWAHIVLSWRTWRCVKLGWLEWEDNRRGDTRAWIDRRGWMRMTHDGRRALDEARRS